MSTLNYIIIASLLISSGSLIGILFLALRKKITEKIILYLISLSAGTLMGGAFIHLIPEASEQLPTSVLFPLVLASFILFFFIEKVLHWRHCHKKICKIHTFGYISLIGDSVHNLIDGLIIAATFLIDIKLGMATTLAIAFHEIPQEIGDFGVLLYSGFKKSKALILNFLVSLTIVIGAVVGYFLSFRLGNLTIYLLPIAAGGFLYISASDLIPEIRKEQNLKESLLSFVCFLIGIAIMYLAKFLIR